MGLKGYRLWGMGQLDSTCRAPPRARQPARELDLHGVQPSSSFPARGVALQVAFERQTLKPVFSLYRL
jgi:hypothetical protein